MVSIKGLNKAEVLKALYDHSHIQGLGFLQATDEPLTIDVCEDLLRASTSFDYLFGRVMKVDLSDDQMFDERLYDRDNGDGAAQKAVDSIGFEFKGSLSQLTKDIPKGSMRLQDLLGKPVNDENGNQIGVIKRISIAEDLFYARIKLRPTDVLYGVGIATGGNKK